MKQQKQVIDWFRSNNMVVSSENFHLIILGKSKLQKQNTLMKLIEKLVEK